MSSDRIEAGITIKRRAIAVVNIAWGDDIVAFGLLLLNKRTQAFDLPPPLAGKYEAVLLTNIRTERTVCLNKAFKILSRLDRTK